MSWEALLSNGEKREENKSDISCWRKLHSYCIKNSLKIKRLKFNGEIIDKNADIYFIIFEGMTFAGSNVNNYKQGIGSYRSKPDQTRITWYSLPTLKYLYTEIQQGKHGFIEEIGVSSANLSQTSKVQGPHTNKKKL